MQSLLQLDLLSIVRERENTSTIEALMIDVCDGHVEAGRMLARLWMWWSRSGKEWIYKSWRDWWAELRMSRKQVHAAHAALERAGVERCVMKAGGAPTCHYRLNVETFGARLDGLGLSPKGAIDCPPAAQSITIESTIKHVVAEEQKPIPIEFLQEGNDQAGDGRDYEPISWTVGQVGLSESAARGLIRQYGRERVVEVCEYAAQQKNLRNPAGFVVDELRTGQWMQQRTHPLTPSPTSPPLRWEDVAMDGGEYAALRENEDEPLPVAREFVKPQLSAVEATPDEAMARAWATAYQQMELQFDRATFDTFLARAKLAGRGAEGEYVIAVPNAYARDMLQHRLYRNVRRLVSDVSATDDWKSVSIRFEVGCVAEAAV